MKSDRIGLRPRFIGIVANRLADSMALIFSFHSGSVSRKRNYPSRASENRVALRSQRIPIECCAPAVRGQIVARVPGGCDSARVVVCARQTVCGVVMRANHNHSVGLLPPPQFAFDIVEALTSRLVRLPQRTVTRGAKLTFNVFRRSSQVALRMRSASPPISPASTWTRFRIRFRISTSAGVSGAKMCLLRCDGMLVSCLAAMVTTAAASPTPTEARHQFT